MSQVATISFTTHSRHLNYGAVLHGWAFQQVLKRMGCESVVIDYLPRSLKNHRFKWPILDTFRCWRRPAVFARRFLQWLFSTCANLRKWRKFERFIHSQLVVTPETYTEDSLVAAERLGDLDPAVFVAESDVIWKRSRRFGMDRGFFLDFPAAAGKRKVAYAPSLAKVGFEGEDGERFARYVRTFSAVSSRERAGAEVLAGILGRDVPWLLDPTLLLSAAVPTLAETTLLSWNGFELQILGYSVREGDDYDSALRLNVRAINNTGHCIWLHAENAMVDGTSVYAAGVSGISVGADMTDFMLFKPNKDNAVGGDGAIRTGSQIDMTLILDDNDSYDELYRQDVHINLNSLTSGGG